MAGRPKNPEDPRQLLDKTLRLIARDLFHIDLLGNAGKLDPAVSRCLIQYNDALLKYVKTEEQETAEEKQRLAKLTLPELAQKAEELAAQAKGRK